MQPKSWDCNSTEITTKMKTACETCNGTGQIKTAVFSHPTLPDGTERIESCDECKSK